MHTGRRLLGVALVATTALLATACGGTSGGGASGEPDNTVVYYTTRPEDGLPALKSAFEAANPGYTLEVIRASSSDTVARLVTEAQAGQQKADLTEMNALPMAELADAGILAPLPASILDPLPEQAKSPDGLYAGTRYFGHSSPYNTELVPAEHQPKSYEDFLDPYWKGGFVIGANDVEWAYQIYASKGEAEGRAFLQKIRAQEPQIRDEGRGALAELVAVGQIKAAIMTLNYHVTNRQAKGLPIEGAPWAPPLLNIDWIATFEDAPHPAATVVFLTWLFGRGGIASDAESGFSRIGDAGTADALDDPGLLTLNPATADLQRKAGADFDEIFSVS